MLSGKRASLTTLALFIGFFLLAASNGLAWLSKDSHPDIPYIIKWQVFNNGTGFLVALLLFFAYAMIEKRISGAWLIAAVAVLCFSSGVLWRYAGTLLMWWVGLNQDFVVNPAMLFIRGGLLDGTTMGLISFVYFGIEHWRRAAEERETARRAIALAHQAQLQMLRYQLNPHFLFNALNSIRGMIIENPARSRDMETELADFLRYSLDGKGQESTIADEIEAIENYLAIQRIRFEEQLDATVQVEDKALAVPVPCFLIHPLVENAVKYGMKTSTMPLRIRIEIACEGDGIGIHVSNTGRLVKEDHSGSQPDGAGIGLKNISERLQLVFPGRHSFGIRENEGWVVAEIHLQTGIRGKEHEAAYGAHRG